MSTSAFSFPRSGPDPAVIAGADFWRNAPVDMVAGAKEWTHFSVMAPQFDLLVNFNLTARLDASGAVTTAPRLALLFRDADGRWAGDVQTFEPKETTILPGSPDVAMGANSARFAAGRYRLIADLPARGLSLDISLRPATFPLVANNIALSAHDAFSWAVVPRLVAEGVATAFGRTHEVYDAPAYHDRNWGRFAWGGGCSWEWATILPEDAALPWSLVFSRIRDRLQGRTLSQSLLLWRGDRLVRKFYGADLAIGGSGMIAMARPLRVPRIAALALPGSAAETPASIEVAATARDDTLSLQVAFADYSQVVFPNDRFPGLTALSEAPGRARIRGRISGQTVDFEARAQAEFNHAA